MAALSRLRQQDRITDLPRELLRRIAEMLPWGRDVANFRLTGRLWRATVPLVNFAPLLMQPYDAESPDCAVTFYRATDGETLTMILPALHGKVVCGSWHGWLALQHVSANLSLLNPFTGAVVDLPSAHKYIHADRPSPLTSTRRSVSLGRVRDVFFWDIVLSSPPDSGDCVAMATLPCSEYVAFCHVGFDRGWRAVRIAMPHFEHFLPRRSIVHCGGHRFLVVGQTMDVSICDVADLEAPRVTLNVTRVPNVSSLILPHLQRGYMNVNGELHVVGSLKRKRGRNMSYITRVYKCDVAREPTWSRVRLHDMTLFVSNNFMTGLSGPTVLGLTKNSIYFAEPLDGPPQEDQDHHNKTQSSSSALCWIQPKPDPWTQGGHGNA